jgi:hypothetical protein
MAHMLDCEGASAYLFQCLAKDTRRLEAARVFIPPTVVFEGGLATAWYYSTSSMEVKQNTSKTITFEMIYDSFVRAKEEAATAKEDPSKDIVAAFVELPTTAPLPEGFTVRPILTSYMTKEDLRHFLFVNNHKPRGLLQKFHYPKGWCNTGIQVTWTRSVTVAEAVRAPCSIADRARTATERCVTFESKHSTPIALSNSVTAAVRTLCQYLIDHLENVEPVSVAAMALRLKVTSSNRVELQYSTCMRVVARKALLSTMADAKPLPAHQHFMTREDFQRHIDLQAHLALYADQSSTEASPTRAVSKPASTTPGPQSPPRRLSPLSHSTATASQPSSPTTASGRADLYAGRASKFSRLVAPRALPSLVKTSEGRWVSGQGHLSALKLQRKLDAPTLETSRSETGAATPATDGPTEKSYGNLERSSHDAVAEGSAQSSNGDAPAAVPKSPTTPTATDTQQTAPPADRPNAELVAALEDLLYKLRQAAAQVDSSTTFTMTLRVEGGTPEVVDVVKRVFRGFNPRSASSDATIIPATDVVLSLERCHGRVADTTISTMKLTSAPLGRSKAFASASVGLERLRVHV